MNDLDLLRAGLAELAEEAEATDLRDRALATSRRLGVRRAALLSVAAAASVAVVATLAVTGGTEPPPPPAVPPTVPPPVNLPAPKPDPEPDVSAFRNVYITVPAWGRGATLCATGRVRLSKFAQYYRGQGKLVLNVLEYVAADVDRDGDTDLVATLMCGESESPGTQVVAFRRQSADELVPIGRVIGTQDRVGSILGLATTGGGRIRVDVSDQYNYGDLAALQHQWRTYAWQGGGFAQVEGPTAFPAHPAVAEPRITVGDLVFRKSAAGPYVGRLVVTVRNTGAAAVPNPTMILIVPDEAVPAGGGWAGCTRQKYGEYGSVVLRCPVGRLAAGGSRSLTLEFVAEKKPEIVDEPTNHQAAVEQAPPYVLAKDSGRTEAVINITVE